MSTKAKVLPRVLTAAIGLAARHFPESTENGDVTVTRDHVLYVLDGHIADWDRWRTRLSTEDALRFAKLLRRRTNQLANADMARRVLDELLLGGKLPGCVPADDYTDMKNPRIVVSPGMPLTDYIDQALAELDQLLEANRKPMPPATSGNYMTTTRVVGVDGTDQTYIDFRYRIEPHHEEPDRPLAVISDAPARPAVVVPLAELAAIAARLDKNLDEVDSGGYRTTSVQRFKDEVRDRAGDEIEELDLAEGELNELLAYTGFGKSVVLIESFACWAVENGVPVAFVLPTNADVVKTTFQIGKALEALGNERASVVPLVSPRALIKVAETAAARASDKGPSDDWIWQRFGYGCALAAVASSEKSVDGWVPGREPCANLRQPVPNRKDKTMSCPWRTTCGRYRAAREACTADVIVTSHVNLQLGMLQTPVDDGHGRNDRVSVEELVLRRCQVVVIDEVDSFQRSMIEQAGRGLVLDRGGRTNTTLRKLDQDFGAAFGMLSDEVDASVRDAYFVLRYLAETYVSHLRYERLGAAGMSKKRRRRPRGPGRSWIVPQRWDNQLANQLFGQPEDADPTDDQMRLFRSIFPDEAAPEAGDPPKYQEMRDHLREVVTNGLGGSAIAGARAKLAEFFDLVGDQDQGLVANRVLRRAILERIRRSLHSLMASNAQLVDIGVEAAQDIADALGTYGRWRVMPTGPLGRLVFAFTEYYDDSGNEPAQLSTAAFGGDPHLYAISLGDVTALAHAGRKRIVLGMSATSYFPHAPHSHLHTQPKWWVADDDADDEAGRYKKVIVKGEQVTDKSGRVVKVSGLDGQDRAEALEKMATLLWPRLEEELRDLEAADRDRARVLLATTSYDGAQQVAEGLAAAGVPASRICLATRPRGEPESGSAVQKGQWWELPADQLESFPAITGADILIAPLGRVQRGVNIIGAADRSALGSVWLLVRPIPLIDEPAELLAHIQARALTCHRGPAGDPLGLLEERRKVAGTYFEEIVRRPPYFRCQPETVKLGVVAEIIVGAVQLIGRARRGGTSAVLHLVDGAFTDDSTGTNFASLITALRDEWRSSGDLRAMKQYYGRTLRAFLEFAEGTTSGDLSC